MQSFLVQHAGAHLPARRPLQDAIEDEEQHDRLEVYVGIMGKAEAYAAVLSNINVRARCGGFGAPCPCDL